MPAIASRIGAHAGDVHPYERRTRRSLRCRRGRVPSSTSGARASGARCTPLLRSRPAPAHSGSCHVEVRAFAHGLAVDEGLMIVGDPRDTQERACRSRPPCCRRSLDKLSNQLGDAHTFATCSINKEVDLRLRQRYLETMHGRRHGDVRRLHHGGAVSIWGQPTARASFIVSPSSPAPKIGDAEARVVGTRAPDIGARLRDRCHAHKFPRLQCPRTSTLRRRAPACLSRSNVSSRSRRAPWNSAASSLWII